MYVFVRMRALIESQYSGKERTQEAFLIEDCQDMCITDDPIAQQDVW